MVTDTGPTVVRRGIEDFAADAGFGFFFVDAHLAAAGQPLAAYPGAPIGAERFDADPTIAPPTHEFAVSRSPYFPYRVSAPGVPDVHAFVRDPLCTRQVWSRDLGYPGDPAYLEFHKIRWPGGLKMWRVTDAGTDLGSKQPYDPAIAEERSRDHARHFQSVLEQEAVERDHRVVVAPFDTELFGHWWYEGIDFIDHLYRGLAGTEGAVRPTTASEHLDHPEPAPPLQLIEGSWGANGDHSMWMNAETQWTWERLWPLEDRFWDRAATAIDDPSRTRILAQAARQLLLAQSSDWQFIISTGVTTDYGQERLQVHAASLERLTAALAPDAPAALVEAARAEVHRLDERDRAFPDVVETLRAVLAEVGSPPNQS